MHSFRKVLLASLSFLLVCALMAFGLAEIYIHSEYAFDEDVRLRRELAGQIDYLFVGASHIQQAVIPSEVDKVLGVSSYILADGWQSIDISRTLFDTERSRNPIREVVLDITFDTMTRTPETDSAERDLYAIPRLENASERLKHIRKTFNFSGYKRVLINYIQYGSRYLICRLRGQDGKNVIDENKGYKVTVSRNVAVADDRVEKLHHSDRIETDWKQENIDGLSEIIRICRENDIKVSVVVMPVSEAKIWHYEGWDIFLDHLKDFCRDNDCRFLDFNLLKERFTLLSDESCYSNTEHLCSWGARYFTPVYAQIMKDREEGIDVSGRFFDSYAEMEEHGRYAAVLKKQD